MKRGVRNLAYIPRGACKLLSQTSKNGELDKLFLAPCAVFVCDSTPWNGFPFSKKTAHGVSKDCLSKGALRGLVFLNLFCRRFACSRPLAFHGKCISQCGLHAINRIGVNSYIDASQHSNDRLVS